MFTRSFISRAFATFTAMFLAAGFVPAQDLTPSLKAGRSISDQREYNRTTTLSQMSEDLAFSRAGSRTVTAGQLKPRRSRPLDEVQTSAFARMKMKAASIGLMSFGTGDGDINEAEPNDLVAQGVSLPVNVFGEISFSHDADFFAFEALAGQQITIEAFAARLAASQLVADIALFDASGQMLAFDAGSENRDPLIRFVSTSDQVLIAGITDLDDLGGRSFDYVLNITRGNDVDELEPNDRTAQQVRDIPATVFGRIDTPGDVDFYSFTASVGQTLIVDVDAEVLGSRLDAEINLTDPETGIEFFYSDQHDGDDPRFNIVLPYTGRFVVGIGAFNSNSSGFYRLNASVVSSAGAPVVTRVTRLAKKLVEVAGSGFTARSKVEVNGIARKTTFVDSNTLQGKAKAKPGDVVTVSNLPDERRSNPMLLQ